MIILLIITSMLIHETILKMQNQKVFVKKKKHKKIS